MHALTLSFSFSLPLVVGDRVSKKEQERDELWKQLDRLKLQYDQKKNSSSFTAEPAGTSHPNRPDLSSSPAKKSVSSLSSKFRFHAKSL